MKRIEYDIKVNTNSTSVVKQIIISVLSVAVGCTLICVSKEESLLKILGIILSIGGGISLLITCFKNLHFRKTTFESHDEFIEKLNEMKSQIPEDKWHTTEETIDLGNTKIKYQSKFYHSSNNKEDFFDEHDVDNLNDVKKIIICPSCGAKNVVLATKSKCQYCDSYLE